jgi:hypothetical protein
MGARNPPGGPGRRSLRCQRAGEQDARAGSVQFRMPVTWRHARRFLTQGLRSCLRPGLRSGTRPCPRSRPGEVGRVRPSPDPLPVPKDSPVVRGGRISDGGCPKHAGPPNWPSASRARGSRDPGRRRRSRPTLTTPRESVPRRTRRQEIRPKFLGLSRTISGTASAMVQRPAMRPRNRWMAEPRAWTSRKRLW